MTVNNFVVACDLHMKREQKKLGIRGMLAKGTSQVGKETSAIDAHENTTTQATNYQLHCSTYIWCGGTRMSYYVELGAITKICK